MAKKKKENRRRFRILSEQIQSVALQDLVTFPVTVGDYPCRVFFKPSQSDPGLQRALGGTLVHLEFEAIEPDLLKAASLAMRLTEDVLAGLAVVTGTPFGGIKFVQLLEITVRRKLNFSSYCHPDISIVNRRS